MKPKLKERQAVQPVKKVDQQRVELGIKGKLPAEVAEALLPIRAHTVESFLLYMRATLPMTSGNVKEVGESLINILDRIKDGQRRR